MGLRGGGYRAAIRRSASRKIAVSVYIERRIDTMKCPYQFDMATGMCAVRDD